MSLKKLQKHFGSSATAKALVASVFILFVIAISAGYAGICDVVKDGLIACYPFNGNANDASGNGNNGTVYGATLTADRFGNSDSAYKFNETDNVIDIGSPNLLSGNLSVSLWAKSLSENGQAIISNYIHCTYSGKGFSLALVDTGKTHRIQFISGTVQEFYSSLDVGRLYHLVLVSNQATNSTSLYVDGIKVKDATGAYISTNDSIKVGNSLGISCDQPPGIIQLRAQFIGEIDDIRIYNRVLSEAEIQEIYNDKDSGICVYTQAQLDHAVKAEQLKWDANGDGRIGLEDIIRMLQVLAGLRP